MKTAIPKPSKQSIIREARDYVMIAIGMILYGIGWTVFLLPNHLHPPSSAIRADSRYEYRSV